MSETEQRLCDYLASHFGVDTSAIDSETPLISSGLIDSFGMVELLLEIESMSGQKVDPGDVTLENLDSISRMATLVHQLRGA